MEHGGPFPVIYGPKFDITRGLPRVLVGRWLLRSTPGNPWVGFRLEIRISAFFGAAGLALEPGGDLAGPRAYLRAVHFFYVSTLQILTKNENQFTEAVE